MGRGRVTGTRGDRSEEGLLHMSAEKLKVPSGPSWYSSEGGPHYKEAMSEETKAASAVSRI